MKMLEQSVRVLVEKHAHQVDELQGTIASQTANIMLLEETIQTSSQRIA